MPSQTKYRPAQLFKEKRVRKIEKLPKVVVSFHLVVENTNYTNYVKWVRNENIS